MKAKTLVSYTEQKKIIIFWDTLILNLKFKMVLGQLILNLSAPVEMHVLATL